MRTFPADLLPDLTGQFVDDGSLLLMRLLGSGAFGKVYEAFDTTSPPDEPVYYAVKCMTRYDPNTHEARMLENELKVHDMLSDHPGVISLHRVFATKDFVFAVLELSTGGDLLNAMVERQCFRGNPALVKQTLGELLDAVEFCHRNSVYHRDIKPENILCNSAGTDIRLADFGLATQISVSRQFGCGSRIFMTPESLNREFSGGCYSARHSDLWAISVIFVNMISGLYPWGSAEVSDRGFAAYRDDKNYLLKALKLTRPTNTLLKQCFHLDPLRRPTLQQFRTALNDIESFSTEDTHSDARVPRLRLPSFAVLPSLEWAVAAAPSAAEDCPTPKPAFPPIYAPKPIRPNPFVLSLTFASSSSIEFAVIASPSLSPSSPPSSVPSSGSSGSSAPSDLSAADSSSPATPATFPADTACVHLCSVPSLAPDSSLPPPLPARPLGHHLRLRALAAVDTDKPAPYLTVAANARPTLPTRRGFLNARKAKIQKESRGGREGKPKKMYNNMTNT